MSGDILSCQELCDPPNGICFRKADIEYVLQIVTKARKGESVEDKETAVVMVDRLLDGSCRMTDLAAASLDIDTHNPPNA